jgi:hypothetical protein
MGFPREVQMSIKTKILGVMAATSAVLGASALPASAQTVGVIAFDGTTSSVTCKAGTLPPPLPPEPVPVVGCPGGSGIPYVGGVGGYAFNTGAAPVLGVTSLPPFCVIVGASALGATGNAAAGTSCSVSSSGVYFNVVCGTGTASGSATITAGTPLVNVGSTPVPTSVSSYTIVFVGGVGVLVTTSINFSSGPSGDGAGVVVLLPADTGNAPGGPCVKNFSVVSAVAAAQP